MPSQSFYDLQEQLSRVIRLQVEDNLKVYACMEQYVLLFGNFPLVMHLNVKCVKHELSN